MSFVQALAFLFGILLGCSVVGLTLLLKANIRCRHCDENQKQIGIMAGMLQAQEKSHIEQLKTQAAHILYVQDLYERALIKQGLFKVSADKPQEKDPVSEADKEQVEKAIKNDGEAFGADV